MTLNRRFALSLVFVLCALLVAVTAAAQEATPEADVFPVTVEHKFGSTTIPEAPQRVVAIGYTDQDALLALGVTPVAIRYWYGDEPNSIFPWAVDEADGAVPEVLNMPYGTLSYETILALDPDLITAVSAGITAEEYELLSQIAPTIPQLDAYIDFGMPWQDATQLIGDAIGQSEAAVDLVAEVDGLFAEAREQNSEFAGQTVAVVYSYGPGSYGFYTAQDIRGRFFSELGFVVPEELVEIAGENFYADLSAERLDLLDQDLIVFANLQFIEGGREAIESDPLFSQLQAVQDGRVVYLSEELENSLGFSSVLSLPFAIEGAVPLIREALGLEPLAEVTPVSEATATAGG